MYSQVEMHVSDALLVCPHRQKKRLLNLPLYESNPRPLICSFDHVAFIHLHCPLRFVLWYFCLCWAYESHAMAKQINPFQTPLFTRRRSESSIYETITSWLPFFSNFIQKSALSTKLLINITNFGVK